jgi:succinate dehydrogenase / fumarate reductase flavoprotein subunit
MAPTASAPTRLLDLLVFGKSAGETAVDDLKNNVKAATSRCTQHAIDRTLARVNRLDTTRRMAPMCMRHASRCNAPCRSMPVYSASMTCSRLVSARFSRWLTMLLASRSRDKSKVFNTARIEALELENLIEVAKATMISAEARKESRGAHVRDDAVDSPETPDGRNDKVWLKHTLWYREGNRLDYKPVQMKPMSVDTIELKKRAY